MEDIKKAHSKMAEINLIGNYVKWKLIKYSNQKAEIGKINSKIMINYTQKTHFRFKDSNWLKVKEW